VEAWRLSTNAWSQPLLLGALGVLLARDLSAKGVWLFSVAALALAMGDAWSFLFLGTATGPVFASRAWRREVPAYFGLLALALALVLGLWLAKHLQGDALARAGLGPMWRGAGGFNLHSPWLADWASQRWRLLGLVAILAWLPGLPALAKRAGLVALGLLVCGPLAAGVLALRGIEDYQAVHFLERAELGAFFFLVLGLIASGTAALYWVQRRHRALRLGPSARQNAALAFWITCLALHFFKAEAMVASHVFDNFRLSPEQQVLQEALETRHLKATDTVATLNPELSYLVAYWTPATMLQPSGFPLHSLVDDAVLVGRYAALLRFYRVSPERWSVLNATAKGWDQDDRHPEALLGEASGYYLLHRSVGRKDRDWKQMVRLALEKAWKEDRKLVPDYVLVDPFSRLLGEPDVSRYKKIFDLNGSQLWSLKTDKNSL